MVGELDALGKGVGLQALRCVFERFKDQDVSLMEIAGAVAHGRAMSAYTKAGLIPFRDFLNPAKSTGIFDGLERTYTSQPLVGCV